MRNLRVLILIGAADLSGAPKMGLYFARGFRATGHKVMVAAARGTSVTTNSIYGALVAEGFKVIPLPELDHSPLRTISRLIEATAADPIDVVVSMVQRDLKYAALLSLVLRSTLVVSGQNITTFGGWWGVRVLKRIAFRLIIGITRAKIIACSDTVAQHYAEAFWLSKNQFAVVLNGVDTVEFAHIRPRLEAGSDSKFTAVTVGRLSPQKGHLILLRALECLGVKARSKLRIWLLGSADDSPAGRAFERELKAAASSMEESATIEFLGWRANVSELLQKCDFCIQPSLWEGFSLAVVEAMASGLPIIMSDCSGRPPGFVDNVHGFVVPRNDASSLAHCIAIMANKGRDELAKMGGACHALAKERFDVAVSAQAFVALTVPKPLEVI